MDAPLECSMCGIRRPYISAHLSRSQPPAFFTVLRAQGRPHIVREVDHSVLAVQSARDQRGVRGVGSSFFRLPQLNLLNCSGLDQRVERLHVGIPFSNSGED